jgi:hypothetical protein
MIENPGRRVSAAFFVSFLLETFLETRPVEVREEALTPLKETEPYPESPTAADDAGDGV